MMSLLKKMERVGYRSMSGALIRTTLSFVCYFAVLLLVGLLVGMVETPNILTNLPDQIPNVLGIVSVLIILLHFFDAKLSTYGIDIDKGWIINMSGGVLIGVIFQAFSTVLLIQLGDARITQSWQTGVFDSEIFVVFAILSTVLAFLFVAIGEDLLFRGVLIREMVTGLESLSVSSRNASLIAILSSSLVFGVIHIGSGAEGLSTGVVVLQAVIGGIYFGIAYVMTNSLAIPVGIHLSTNVWTTVVFGQVDTGYPMVFTLKRDVSFEPSLIISLVLPSVLLVLCVVAWVSFVMDDELNISLGTEY